MLNVTRVADYLSDELEKLGFIIMSERSGRGLPLVAFRLRNDDSRLFDEFAIAHVLRERGWIIPAYTMAPHSNKLKMMRIVLREGFTMNRCTALVDGMKAALESLEEMDKETIEKYTQYGSTTVLALADKIHRYVRVHGSNSAKARALAPTPYKDDHSLQGKTEKTHAIC